MRGSESAAEPGAGAIEGRRGWGTRGKKIAHTRASGMRVVGSSWPNGSHIARSAPAGKKKGR